MSKYIVNVEEASEGSGCGKIIGVIILIVGVLAALGAFK